MTRPTLALLALVGALSSGCGLLTAEVQVRTVCTTVPDYAFPGVPVSGTLQTRITYDLGSDVSVVSDPTVDFTLRLKQVWLVLGSDSGLASFRGVDLVDVAVLPPAGSSLPEAAVLHYARGDAAVTTEIAATSTSDLDVSPYLSAGQLSLEATAQGTLPTTAWTATVTACFELTVTKDYGKSL
jgi:hypothetical protein